MDNGEDGSQQASQGHTQSCIATGLQSVFPTGTANVGGATKEIGGHWNFTVQLQFASYDAATAFTTTYNAAAAMSWGAIDPPARFGPGPALHVENVGSWAVVGGMYGITATTHIDLYNPHSGVGGFFGHVLVDGALGHVVQFFGGNIDPTGCPF